MCVSACWPCDEHEVSVPQKHVQHCKSLKNCLPLSNDLLFYFLFVYKFFFLIPYSQHMNKGRKITDRNWSYGLQLKLWNGHSLLRTINLVQQLHLWYLRKSSNLDYLCYGSNVSVVEYKEHFMCSALTSCCKDKKLLSFVPSEWFLVGFLSSNWNRSIINCPKIISGDIMRHVA